MERLFNLAHELVSLYKQKSYVLVTAESCTGGMVASALIDVPGASHIYDRGFITYSDIAKHETLGVDESMLEQYGAVSEQVAVAMAEGALKKSRGDRSLAITGIAGPTGGTDSKPVGLVYIATGKIESETVVHKYQFQGNRANIRLQAAEYAIQLLIDNK